MFVSLLFFVATLLSGATAETLKTPNNYNYIPVESFKQSAGEVIFKVKAKNDAHVALSMEKTHTSKKYEIVIGGWSNNYSVIRPGNQQRNLVVKKAKPLDASQYKRFRISWDKSKITVENEVSGKWSAFMELSNRDKPPHDKYNWDFKYMMVSTGWGATGEWEIEESKSCRGDRSLLEVSVKADDKGEETRVHLKRWSDKTKTWAKRKSFNQVGVPSKEVTVLSHCLNEDKCYKLAIKDKGKDGITEGGYTVKVDGVLIADSKFSEGAKETHNIGCDGDGSSARA